MEVATSSQAHEIYCNSSEKGECVTGKEADEQVTNNDTTRHTLRGRTFSIKI